MVSDGIKRELSHVGSVNFDRAAVDVVKTTEQIHRRRFAGSGRADQSQDLPARNR